MILKGAKRPWGCKRHHWLQTTEVMMERFETELAYANPSALDDAAARVGLFYDPDYRARLEKEAARLQAEAVRRSVVALGRALRAAFLGTFRVLGMIAKGAAAVRLYEDLSSLDDAALANMGITRDGISRFVMDAMDGTLNRKQAVPGPELSAIDGGRSERPVEADDLAQRRAA